MGKSYFLFALVANFHLLLSALAASKPGDVYDHVKNRYLPENTVWLEVGFVTIYPHSWTTIEATFQNFSDPLVFLSLPTIATQNSLALRVRNTKLEYVNNDNKRYTFQAKSYGVQDSFCNTTLYNSQPSELVLPAATIGWLVVERGMFNVSHRGFIVNSDTINRTNSDLGDPRNQFKASPPNNCNYGTVCRLNVVNKLVTIGQLQTTRFDRFLLLRSLAQRRRTVVYILVPHDSVQAANFYIPNPGEVYAWILFENDVAVACAESIVIETKSDTLTNLLKRVSFSLPFSAPPAIFGLINEVAGGDSISLRAGDIANAYADIITQEDRCADFETVHSSPEKTAILVIGRGSAGTTRCGASLDFLTAVPSLHPTRSPTVVPSHYPTRSPTVVPSHDPTRSPTVVPSHIPTRSPTVVPSHDPTRSPTVVPSHDPTRSPTVVPSHDPTRSPTSRPSHRPSASPTAAPTSEPSPHPSSLPSGQPTSMPSSSVFIVGSSLNSDGFSIVVSFNVPIDLSQVGTSSFPCNEVLDFLLAQFSSCTWTSSSILSVKLYAISASGLLGSISASELGLMRVVPQRIMSLCANCSSYAESSHAVPIELPQNPQEPMVALSTSSRYVTCAGITIDATKSTGKASLNWLNIEWTIQGSGDTSKISQFLAANYSQDIDTAIDIPAIIANSAGDFTVTLSLTNFFGLTRRTSVFILSNDGLTRPAVSILGSQHAHMKRSQSLFLFTRTYIPDCLGIGLPKLTYIWSIWVNETREEMSIASLSKDPRRLRLGGYSLNSSITYEVQVDTYVEDTRAISSSYSVFVTVDPSYGATAKISGGDFRTVSSADSWSLDASGSSHLDRPDAPLSFSWSCFDIETGATCGLSLPGVAQITIAAGALSFDHTYRFTVLVSSSVDDGVSEAFVLVAVSPDQIPVITMGNVAEKIDPTTYMMINCTIDTPFPIVASWSSPEIDPATLDWFSSAPLSHSFAAGVHFFALKLEPGLVTSGRFYTFTVSASAVSSSDISPLRSLLSTGVGDSLSLAEVFIEINVPPYNGVLNVIPTQGVAVNTTFQLTTKSWIAAADNYPLMYRINYYITDPDARLVVLGLGQLSYVQAVFGEGDQATGYSMTCVAGAVDVYGSAGEVETGINVFPNKDELSWAEAVLEIEGFANSTDFDRIDQLTSGYAKHLSIQDCSNSPDCSALNRQSCSEFPNTCGSCLADFVGLAAPSSHACVVADPNNSTLKLTGNCTIDAECLSYQCDGGSCVSEVLAECPDSCSGHGSCQALDSSREAISSCSVFNPYCSVECKCTAGYHGKYCQYDDSDFDDIQNWQELLCTEYLRLSELIDLSSDAAISRAAIMNLLLQDLTVLNPNAFENCAAVVIGSINANAALCGDDTTFDFWLDVLSKVLATPADGSASTEVMDAILAAVTTLVSGAQEHLTVGQSKDFTTEHVRVVTRLSYPNGELNENQFFSVPITAYESAAGVKFGTIDLGEVSPVDSSEVGHVLILYLKIPAGIFGNSTRIEFQSIYYGDSDSGRRRLVDADVVRNVTVVLPNVSPFRGDKPFTTNEIVTDCFFNLENGVEASYLETVYCGDVPFEIECLGNSTYSVIIDCISDYLQPHCISEGVELIGRQNCTVVEYSELNTTCLCTEQFSLLSEIDATPQKSITRNYGVTATLVGESFSSRFGEVNHFSSGTVERNGAIFGIILGLVLFLVLGGALILYSDFVHIEYAAIREKYVDSGFMRARSFKALVHSSLPIQFSSLPWHLRYKALLLEQHEWMALFFADRSDYSQHNNFVLLLWVHAFGKLINFFFVGTVLAVLYFSDDETCGEFSSRNSCEEAVSIDLQSSLCEWNSSTRTCDYVEQSTTFGSAIAVAIAINILVAPVDAMLRFLLLIARRVLIQKEDKVLSSLEGRKVRSCESYLGGELCKMQTGKSKMMCAARLSHMKKHIDESVTVFGEVEDFLQLHAMKRASKMDGTSKAALLERQDSALAHQSASRVAVKWGYLLKESMYDAPAHMIEKQLWEDDLARTNVDRSSHVYWLMYNMRRARDQAKSAQETMKNLPDDDTRDEYLLRLFFVEAMVGYRRQLASLFFLDRNKFGFKSGMWSSKTIQWLCTIFIPVYLIFFCFYIFIFGVSIGPSSTNLWLVCICFAYLQNVVLIEPVLIYFYGITLAGLIYRDVMTLAARIRLHGNEILTRHQGTTFAPSESYVHHINAACRAARGVPQLVVSRLLISFNDWDLPVSFMPYYHQTGVIASCIRGMLFFQAMLALVFLYLLPTAFQEIVVEIVLSLLVGFILIVFYLSSAAGPAPLGLAFVLLFLMFLILAIVSYFCFRKKIGPRSYQFDAKEHDAALSKASILSANVLYPDDYDEPEDRERSSSKVTFQDGDVSEVHIISEYMDSAYMYDLENSPRDPDDDDDDEPVPPNSPVLGKSFSFERNSDVFSSIQNADKHFSTTRQKSLNMLATFEDSGEDTDDETTGN